MESGATPQWRMAIREDAPQSIRKRVSGASTRIQVWKRPPAAEGIAAAQKAHAHAAHG